METLEIPEELEQTPFTIDSAPEETLPAHPKKKRLRPEWILGIIAAAAAALLAAVEDHARARGGRLMIGGITGSNEGSLRFHERHGYARWGFIPSAGWKFGQFHDLVLMGRVLTTG